MKTKWREEQDGGITIPAAVMEQIGKGTEGKLTPTEALALSLVASFSRRGQPCFLSNGYFADALGYAGKNRLGKAKGLVNSLVEKNYLRSVLRTHGEMRELIAEHYGEEHGFIRRGERTSRLLIVTMESLLPKEVAA